MSVWRYFSVVLLNKIKLIGHTYFSSTHMCYLLICSLGFLLFRFVSLLFVFSFFFSFNFCSIYILKFSGSLRSPPALQMKETTISNKYWILSLISVGLSLYILLSLGCIFYYNKLYQWGFSSLLFLVSKSPC